MKDFIRMLRELKTSIEAIWIFGILINAGLIFMGTFLILSVFTFLSLYSIVPAVVYVVVALYVKLKHPSLKEVEDRYYTLRERLRTASQYRKESNPIVDELKREVMRELHLVRVSLLVNTKQLTLKVGVMLILIFSIMFVGFLQEDLLPLKFAIRDTASKIPADISSQFDRFGENTISLLESSLYGETLDSNLGDDPLGKVSDEVITDETIAALGDDVIDLVINDFGFELDLGQEDDYDDEAFGSELAVELYANAADTYNERIDEDERIVVKNYFNALAG